MADRPILFSAPMVRALLAGRKTQTRRVMKPVREVPEALEWVPERGHVSLPEDGYWAARVPSEFPGTWYTGRAKCPYGVPCDRLWVRETFRLRADQDDKPPSQDWWKSGAWYQADGGCEPSGCGGGAGKLRPSIFMPRWASRITLEITEVRVQRLQEISGEDAEEEGVFAHIAEHSIDKVFRDARAFMARTYFRELWDRINGEDSWDANPWVWALTFKRVRP